MTRKILFLVPYPLQESPSQRFRFEQYFDLLTKEGFQFRIQTFLDSHNWQLFFKSGNAIGKGWALFRGFTKRFIILLALPSYDFVFIHREASPLGPPVIEWLITHLFKKKIIYDFDDAIWLTDRQRESGLFRFLKWRSKVGSVCRWAYKVSCGNEYLCSFARQFNKHVLYNPTTLDTIHWHNPDLYTGRSDTDPGIVIGWTGSHSTLKYLQAVEGSLQKLEREFPALRIVVIADQPPSLRLSNLSFIPWNEKTEVEDLMQLDIGIMPLPDDEWSKGKCGFKALQYLALRIPAVASPVGVNSAIIEDGSNGFLAASDGDWERALRTLILDTGLRKRMGEKGREKVIASYSVVSNSSSFLSLFG